jgi:lipid II:glycine glycyltransferase (peptidoglycan interpeptide bridge formation enzyme)
VTSPTVLTVQTIPESAHLDFLRRQRSASFLQTPAWGRVKSEWRRESLGWYAGSELVGVGLVLFRDLPKVDKHRVRKPLAYLPEGPVIDWSTDDLAAWLTPMVTHLKRAGAFGVRIGPPVVTARWTAAQVKEGIASDQVNRLTEVAPSERNPEGARVVSQLHELGWRPQGSEGGFAAGQPQYNFWVPLTSRTEDEVLKGMNQLWRRNIKKATKEGVEVTVTRGSLEEVGKELAAFHDLYVHTADRDHFTPRPLSYFETMWRELSAEEPDRILLFSAHHEGDLVASTIWIRVGGHTWYSYGASSTHKREVRGSNAVQWAMMQESIRAGADVYDLRGITDTLDADDAHVGLIQFKVGTGGEAVEYAGEWDLPMSGPINRGLYKAFDLYMSRRG